MEKDLQGATSEKKEIKLFRRIVSNLTKQKRKKRRAINENAKWRLTSVRCRNKRGEVDSKGKSETADCKQGGKKRVLNKSKGENKEPPIARCAQ